MKYLISKDFTKIDETSGTVQNSGSSGTIEMSETNEPDTGVLLYPQQKHSFRDAVIYLRCIDGWAEARVVPFKLDEKGGDDNVDTVILNGEEYSVATNAGISTLLDDIFG